MIDSVIKETPNTGYSKSVLTENQCSAQDAASRKTAPRREVTVTKDIQAIKHNNRHQNRRKMSENLASFTFIQHIAECQFLFVFLFQDAVDQGDGLFPGRRVEIGERLVKEQDLHVVRCCTQEEHTALPICIEASIDQNDVRHQIRCADFFHTFFNIASDGLVLRRHIRSAKTRQRCHRHEHQHHKKQTAGEGKSPA